VPLRPAHDANASATDDTIVGISFADTYRAQEFVIACRRLAAQHELELRDVVLVVKDASGKTVVHETIDPQPVPSALSGAMWAGLFGLILGGPVGWIAGVAIGAGTGAVSAKVVDLGVPDEWVAWFRDAVQTDTTTVVLLLGTYDREATFAELERFAGGHLVYANVGSDVTARIRDALDDPTLDAPALPADAPTDAPS
jgi:uncharacterized membrane protein